MLLLVSWGTGVCGSSRPLSSPGTVTDGKLVLVWAPLDASRSSVDTQENEDGLPPLVGWRPDVCVTILRTGNDTVGVRGPRDRSDELVVLPLAIAHRLRGTSLTSASV